MSQPDDSIAKHEKPDLSGSLQPHEVNGFRQKGLDPRDYVALSLVGSKTTIVGVDASGNVVMHLETRVPPDVLEGFKKQMLLLATGELKVPDVAGKIPFNPEIRLLLPTDSLTLNAQRQMDASLLMQRQNLGAALAAQVKRQAQQSQQQSTASAAVPAVPAAPVAAPVAVPVDPSFLDGKVWTTFPYDETTRTWTMGFADGTSARCRLMAQVVNPPMYESPDAAPLRARCSEGATGQTIVKASMSEDPDHGPYTVLELSDGSEICVVLVS